MTHQAYFETKDAIKFFDRFATYIGSDPYRAPGILSSIPHLEHGQGAYYSVGGMRSIADAVSRLCIDKGVMFKFNSPVESLIVAWLDERVPDESFRTYCDRKSDDELGVLIGREPARSRRGEQAPEEEAA